MAIKNGFMSYAKAGLSNGESVSLTPKTGSSLLIKDVIVNGADSPYADLYTAKTTVGRYRVRMLGLGNNLMSPQGNNAESPNIPKASGVITTLIRYLESIGVMNGYPVAEGETFVVKPSDDTKTLGDVILVYEEYDAEDIKASDPNGSEAQEYSLVAYGQVAGNITDSGIYKVSQSNLPSEFTGFPFEEVVPSNTEIELVGIIGSEVERFTSATQYIYTDRLKMVKDRQVLFDDSKEGILFRGLNPAVAVVGYTVGAGSSLIGGYSNIDGREPHIFSRPILFKAGEELGVNLSTVAVGIVDPLEASYTEIAFILSIHKAGVSA